MKGALFAAAVLALALAGQAQAVTLVNPDGTPSRYQRWASRLPVPTLRGTAVVYPNNAPCLGSQGCNDGTAIWFIRYPHDDGNMWVLAHELGHLFDYHVMTDADRARLTPMLGGNTATPWFGDDYASSLEEAFGDSYANCTLKGWGGETFTGPDGGGAAQDNEQRICRTITAIARLHPQLVRFPPRRPSPRHRDPAGTTGRHHRLAFVGE